MSWVYLIVYIAGLCLAFTAYKEFKAIFMGLPDANSNLTPLANMTGGGARNNQTIEETPGFTPFTGKATTLG